MSDDERTPEEAEEEERERYRELLEELRTVNPGVQVLFAFLLTAPFANRFAEIDHVGRIAYMVTLLGVGFSAVLFLTPASYHRIAPRSERAERIRVSVRLAVAGMVVLMVAITSGVFLVARFVFGPDEGRWIAGALGLFTFVLWYAVPFRRRLRLRPDREKSSIPP